ncbi:MAG: response regulator, partial [Chlorobi bacterium]|nr:response regulator [Chlorobiota bacterium]
MNTGYPYEDSEKKRVKWDEVREVISQSGVAESFEQVSALDFKDLMRNRINNILLVSSMYDFYTLVEDGQLTEAIFNEYLELNLHYAPHITRVHSGEAALRMLGDHRFDLVISMQRISDMDLVNFCRSVKRNHPDIPVVFLGYQSRELQLLLQTGIISVFDRIFIWQGDRRLFLAIIKLFEDLKNAPVDCLEFGVRTIILVEDSPLFYSSYLPLIYTELIKQAQSLIVEGRNFSDKLLRQRARPKILHATSFDEAWEYFKTYKDTLLGIITDMKFKKNGKVVDNAGLQLIQQVREESPDLPILIQSAHSKYTSELEMLNVCYADKNSRTLLQEVSEFIKKYFGFGDFVFRMPDGTEIKRAKNLKELRDLLKTVPDESIIYHGSRNHFSNWLMARTKFALAKKIKPVKISQFASMDELRSYLIEVFTEQLHKDQQGIISDFPGEGYDIEEGFLRIGSGSLGGKARGLAFVDNLLKNYLESNYFPGVRVSIPRTIVLGTDIFDQFLENNGLLSFALQSESDEQIIERFVQAELPMEI